MNTSPDWQSPSFLERNRETSHMPWGAYESDDQDYWQMSGIQRDVTRFAKPRVHLRDFTIQTHFDRDYCDATVEVTAFCSRCNAETPVLYTAVLTLRNQSGEVVDAESARVGFRQVEIRDAFEDGDTGWTQNIHPEFQVNPALYFCTFMIEPIVRR